uniref:Uncharacterized protein n=1 Tax=Chrysotila carterae TaxID=13221 RepID=A0A7S4EZQ3_CHRCT
MPTVLELAGIWPHKDGQRQHRLLQPPMAMEGESMVNAWLGRPYAPRRRSLMWRAQTNPSDTGLAMRTDRWKLHVIPSKVARKWKQHEGKDSTKKEYKMPNGDLVELYDIDNDLTELKSVAHSNQEVVSNLVAELLRWNDTLPTKAEMDHQRKAYKEYYSRKTRSQERRLEEEAESSSDTSFEIDNAAIWAIVRALNATKQKLRARINPARVSENSIAARHGSSIAARHVSSESHSAIELLHSRSGLSDNRSRNSGSSSSGGDFTGAKVASVENSYELKRLRAKLLSLIGPRDGSSCWKEAYRKLPPMVDPTASALLQETNADVTRSVIKRP